MPMHDNQMSVDVSSSASNAADKAFLAKFAGNPIDKAQQKCHVLVVPQHFDFETAFSPQRHCSVVRINYDLRPVASKKRRERWTEEFLLRLRSLVVWLCPQSPKKVGQNRYRNALPRR